MAQNLNIDIGNKIYPKKEMRKLATETWEELPDAIIINEDIKELNAKKEAGQRKMNKKAMSRGHTNQMTTEVSEIIEEDTQVITNQNARQWVEGHLFGDVRLAMKNLIEHIQTSGELEKYWTAVDQQNNDARKAARKLERERKKIEMGSDFEDSGNEEPFKPQEDSWEQSSESDQDEEYGSEVEQSQLDKYDGDGTCSPENNRETNKDNTQYAQGFIDKSNKALIDLQESTNERVGSIEPPSAGLKKVILQEPMSAAVAGSKRNISDKDSQSRVSGYRSGMSRRKKPLPFNALRFIAQQLKAIKEEKESQQSD